MVALVFVLARNVLKLVVERRRALPFARFRAKLVAVLLGMTLIPAVLVLIVGSELIRNSASRWFSAADRRRARLGAARSPATTTRSGSRPSARTPPTWRARSPTSISPRATSTTIRGIVGAELGQRQLSLIEVYRIDRPARRRRWRRSSTSRRRACRRASRRPSCSPRAPRRARANWSLEPLPSGGELVRGSAPIRPSPGAPPTGVVVASVYLTDELARHSRRIVDAYQAYEQLRVLRQPLEGVYLSFFLGLTLLILISATWMGLYLAKRITRPVQRLAAGAREIGAGHLDHRIEPETHDEFGALVEAFNKMAGELA